MLYWIWNAWREEVLGSGTVVVFFFICGLCGFVVFMFLSYRSNSSVWDPLYRKPLKPLKQPSHCVVHSHLWSSRNSCCCDQSASLSLLLSNCTIWWKVSPPLTSLILSFPRSLWSPGVLVLMLLLPQKTVPTPKMNFKIERFFYISFSLSPASHHQCGDLVKSLAWQDKIIEWSNQDHHERKLGKKLLFVYGASLNTSVPGSVLLVYL